MTGQGTEAGTVPPGVEVRPATDEEQRAALDDALCLRLGEDRLRAVIGGDPWRESMDAVRRSLQGEEVGGDDQKRAIKMAERIAQELGVNWLTTSQEDLRAAVIAYGRGVASGSHPEASQPAQDATGMRPAGGPPRFAPAAAGVCVVGSHVVMGLSGGIQEDGVVALHLSISDARKMASELLYAADRAIKEVQRETTAEVLAALAEELRKRGVADSVMEEASRQVILRPLEKPTPPAPPMEAAKIQALLDRLTPESFATEPGSPSAPT